jgi:hypothetical protein
MLEVTFTRSRWLVLAAAPNVVATWRFGVGIVGFRADTLPGFGLPEASNPTALSRYLNSRFVDSAGVRCFYGIPGCTRPRAERAAPLGRSPSRPSGSRCRGRIPEVMTTLSQEHRIYLASRNVRDYLGRSWTNWGPAMEFSDVGPCRSSPHTRGSRPFSPAGFLLTQEGAQKNRSACPSPRPLRSQAARSRPAGQPAHRQTLDLDERVGLSATAVRRRP